MGKHKHTLLFSFSVHFPPSLFFHLHFMFSALVLFLCIAAHPAPAVTFVSLCILLFSKEHIYTPFWRLSGCISHVISYPERPDLSHLPRMNNRIHAEYSIYYVHTEVMYLMLSSPGHLKFIVTPRQMNRLQHHK